MVEIKKKRDPFLATIRKKFSAEMRDRIMLAYKLAKYGHMGQKRQSGEEYFEHPKRVVLILMEELGIYDHEMIIAALFHDILEDSFILTSREIELIFGPRVRKLVDVLTKPEIADKTRKYLEYFFHLIHSEKAAFTIKLADRLSNMRELDECSPEMIRKQVKETEDIFIPLTREMESPLLPKLIEATEHAKSLLQS